MTYYPWQFLVSLPRQPMLPHPLRQVGDHLCHVAEVCVDHPLRCILTTDIVSKVDFVHSLFNIFEGFVFLLLSLPFPFGHCWSHADRLGPSVTDQKHWNLFEIVYITFFGRLNTNCVHKRKPSLKPIEFHDSTCSYFERESNPAGQNNFREPENSLTRE